MPFRPPSTVPALLEAPSAGGAPVDQILVVAGFTAAVYVGLAWVILRERSGRPTLVGRAATAVARVEGGPRWFALPATIAVLGALSGATGVYWDVSFHIAHGRDDGPLANPAHYFIFLGLVAIFAGGALGMALRDQRMPERTLRLTRRWSTPVGPALGTATALCALAGFPLDDLWHRLFGQDVTEWGPTHVLMIGGTIMLPYTMLLTVAEARQVGGSRLAGLLERVAVVVLVVGPVAFLLEYAYGVPQFPLINDVVIITLASTVGFGVAMYRGARSVIAVWAGYAVVQAGLVATNTYVWDAMTPKMPLCLGGALAAAALARWARPTPAFAAGSGALTGVATVAVDYVWTGWHRPLEWPDHLLPWAVATAAVTGAGVGVLAAWLHVKLQVVGGSAAPAVTARPRPDTAPSVRGPVAGLAALAVLAVFVVNVPPRTAEVGEVDVRVGDVRDGRAQLAVHVPETVVEDAYWWEALSWQGGGMVRSELVRIAPGHYRTLEPVPVTGRWKTLVRLQTSVHTQLAAPVYLPADPAIPAPEHPAADGPRAFVTEHLILQRERRQDVPLWLWGAAYVVVGGVFLLLLGSVAAGYTYAGRPRTGPSGSRRPAHAGTAADRGR